jgi:hypothetical protein
MASDRDRRTTRHIRPWRIRISLKAVFLIITVLCIWLAIRTTRERRSEGMVDVYVAIHNAIMNNMGSAPDGASIVPAKLHGVPAEIQIGGFERTKRFAGENLNGTVVVEVPLKLEDSLMEDSSTNISGRLLTHYERGFDQIGLRRAGTRPNDESTTAVWRMPEHGVCLVIDVLIDLPAKNAKVRTIFIQNDAATIW